MSLRTQILEVSKLSERQIVEMFDLFSQYYVNVSFDHFKMDLSEKTHVFYFTDSDGLAGFSTIFRRNMPEISRGLILFSGDTVTKQKYWGAKILQKAFFHYIVASKLRTPFTPLYWMLMSKGFKTYMMMRKNFATSYPVAHKPTPELFLKVQNAFYHWKFQNRYSSTTHLIHFPQSLGAVKGNMADPHPRHLQEPDVRAFLQMNPSYSEGVELACIAEIRFQDFFFHLFKFFIPKPAQRIFARLRASAIQD